MSLKSKLNSLIKNKPDSIAAAVASEALGYHEIKPFFSDLLQHGCQSGMVSSLIYYCDTHKFFDTHYEEIEDLRHELESSLGECLQPKGDLKNWFAWLAFEETARIIADELGIAY